jgi:sugar lactone lactonase YvrE
MRSIFAGVVTRGLALSAVVVVVGLCAAASALASPTFELSRFAGVIGSSGAPTAGPATSSTLSSPEGVAVDASGSVYIADVQNERVEKVTSSGQLSTIAGTGTAGAPTAGAATSSDLHSPDAVAVDAAGNVYIADLANYLVEKVTPAGQLSIFAGNGSGSGTPTAGSATATTIGNVGGIAVDSSGNVYIADTGGSRVLKVTPSGQLSFYAGNGTSGAPTPGSATSSDLGEPEQLAVDAAGDLFIADTGDNLVEKVTPSGTLSVFAGNGAYGAPAPGAATSSPLDSPASVAVDAAGDLYIGNLSQNIDEVTPTGTLSVIAGNDTYGAPTYGVPATSSDLGNPEGIASTPSGRLYVAETFRNLVDLLTPSVVANTTPPTISGSPVVGDTLTAGTGTWSNSPVLYAYQWEDCDSTGANCTPITGATVSTYVVTSADDGHTIRVVVTGQNGGGSASATSAATAAVPSPTAVVPSPTGPLPVTVGAIPSGGITVNDDGEAMLTLVCPVTPSGCDASGVLTIHLPSTLEAHATNVVTANATAADDTVLATFSGEEIASGQSRLIAVRLRATVLRRLQTLRIRRVRVTLTISNHLSGGPAVNSTQTVYLLIPALARNACPSSTGQISSTTVGEIAIGRTRAGNRRLDRRYRVYNPHTDNYCLYQGKGIRAVYASAKLLGPAGGAVGVKGDAVLVMTANPFYSLDGVRPGTRLAAAARHLKLGKAIQIGRNDWYVIAGARRNGILRVRNGVIIGVGIANRQLTRTRPEQVHLLSS